MNRYRTLLKPNVVFTLAYTISLVMFFLYQSGLVKSMILLYRHPLPFVGSLFYFGLLSFQIFLLSAFQKVRIRRIHTRIHLSIPFIDCMLSALLLVSFYGIVKGAGELLSLAVTKSSIFILLAGRNKDLIEWGSGYTLLTLMAFVPLNLTLYRVDTRGRLIKYLSALSLILSGLAYAARLRLIYVIVVIVTASIRRKYYNTRPRILIIAIISIVVVGLLGISFIARSGNKDLRGVERTELVSAFTNIIDYFSSTVLFSIHGLDLVKHENDFNSVRLRFGDSQTILGYTNSGRYWNIFSIFGLFSYFYLILECFIIVQVWKEFDAGERSGLTIYPMVLYSLMEGSRMDPLMTLDYLIPFILSCILVSISGNGKKTD